MPYSWTGPVCMRGWWQCCGCGREVEEKTWDFDCPDCSHHICDSCTAIERARFARHIHPIEVHAAEQHTGLADMTGWWGYGDRSATSIHGGRGLIWLHLQVCGGYRYSASDPDNSTPRRFCGACCLTQSGRQTGGYTMDNYLLVV
jgi:hypothetical protein